jgi:hypothetical protein
MPKSLESKINSSSDRDREAAFLSMSGMRKVDIAKMLDISTERLRQLLARYWRSCEAIKKFPYKADRYDHPNTDIIKSIYEEKSR